MINGQLYINRSPPNMRPPPQIGMWWTFVSWKVHQMSLMCMNSDLVLDMGSGPQTDLRGLCSPKTPLVRLEWP